jgi:Holliday junction resolvase-like predicted endonuclease|tara:strand:+ start:102 stop:437 length:336 start_codon:yes stop_codon:yes gene_type:complete
MAIGNNKPIKSAKLSIQSTKLTKAQKGTIGEYQAIVDLTKQGYYVALACNPQCPFDLVAVNDNGDIRLIDVKSNTYRKKSKKTYKKSLKIYRCPTKKQKQLKIELMMVDNE